MRFPRLPELAAACLFALVVAPASAAPAKTAATPRNLLANPGFEESLLGHAWMPAAWDTFESGLNTVFFGRDTLLAHEGRYAVSVANLSTYIPMFHNWSQTLVVGREQWGKDVVFTIWTRSNGLQGRAYILLQAYRDTVAKMAKEWNVDRATARDRLRIPTLEDPLMSLGWDREYFSEPETEWVRREVRIFVPPSTNILLVRGGIFGVGQVMFDDASLVATAARPPESLPLNTNLLRDPGFEGDGNDWEYSMPPYEGMVIEPDTAVFHGGRTAMRLEGGLQGPVPVRAGVCQVIANRGLSGKRLRFSGWIRTDSLESQAYMMVYCSTAEGEVTTTPAQFGMNTEWTETVSEIDTPPGTLMVWVWYLYNAPASGRLYYDDTSLVVLGPAEYITKGTPPPRPFTKSGH